MGNLYGQIPYGRHMTLLLGKGREGKGVWARQSSSQIDAHDSGINRPYMQNVTSFGYIGMNFI